MPGAKLRRPLFLFAALSVAPLMLAQQPAPSAAPAAPTPQIPGSEAFEARVFSTDAGEKLPYRILKPLAESSPSGKKFPLVLFLHGAGERGDENVRQLIHGGRNFAEEAFRRRHPAFVVAPQCPTDKKWVEVDWSAESHSMPVDPGPTMNRLFALLDSLQKELPIDADRIYAVGLSMGGYGTWDILARKPQLLAAAIPICGGGDPAQVAGFVGTPVWAFHGSVDSAVPVERSRHMIRALEAAGGRPIYTEYEGVDHNSWTQTFDNRLVWDWLFAQRRGK
jgi:predicted peptidase